MDISKIINVYHYYLEFVIYHVNTSNKYTRWALDIAALVFGRD